MNTSRIDRATVRPRRLAHRGRLMAKGLFFDAHLYPEALVRARVLERWVPGTTVHQTALGVVLVHPKPVPTMASEAPGAPLVPHDHCLLAAPLDKDELKMLRLGHNEAVLVSAGQAHRFTLSANTQLDPSEWLELGPLEQVEVRPLGDPPAPPKVTVEKSTVRKIFGQKKVSEEAKTFMELLKRRAQKNSKPSEPKKQTEKKPKPARPSPVREQLSRFFSWLSERAKPAASPSKPKPKPKAGDHKAAFLDDVSPKTPSGPSWLDRLSQRLESWADKLAQKSKIASALEKTHNKYINKLMGMLDNENLDDALRHAIPLSDLEGGDLGSGGFGLFGPRSGLNFSSGVGGRRSVALGGNIFDTLKERYQRVFEKLKAEGRYQEAAFVLAELLNRAEEAVALLESQGMHQLAAELAQARELAPALIVRQWALAGEWVKAVRVARRTGAFADAVMQLQKTHPEQAKSLRLLWADHLADRGEYNSAMKALWPVEEARHLAEPWITAGLQLGGSAGAKMMVSALELLPEKQEALQPLIMELLEDDAADGAMARRSFADALHQSKASPALDLFAKPTVRSLYRDAAQLKLGVGNNLVNGLIKRANDRTFHTDLPAYSAAGPKGVLSSQAPFQITVPSSDTGSMRIERIAPLPDGRFLAALGEAGVLLLNRQGRAVTHFNVPASQLVCSDAGHHAIALSFRGDVVLLSKIDLSKRIASTWCETQLECYAPTYDGSVWFVGLKPQGTLAGIDTTSDHLEALWHLDEVRAEALARSGTSLGIRTKVQSPGDEASILVYRLPTLATAEQRSAARPEGGLEGAIEASALTAQGDTLYLCRSVPLPQEMQPSLQSKERWFVILVHNTQVMKRIEVQLPPLSAPLHLDRDDDWVVLTASAPGQAVVLLLSLSANKVCARFDLEGAQRAIACRQENTLTAWDDRGRLLQLDLLQGRLLSNHRLHP